MYDEGCYPGTFSSEIFWENSFERNTCYDYSASVRLNFILSDNLSPSRWNMTAKGADFVLILTPLT
jgi:hypothetical protein